MNFPSNRLLHLWGVACVFGLICSDCSNSGAGIQSFTPLTGNFDVVVYGGTPSGIMAAIQAARLGKTVMLIEPTAWIGGMVAGGLSVTDAGTWSVIGGLALEFFQNTTVLEKPRNVNPVEPTGVAFNVEPHIAQEVFTSMLADAGVPYRAGSPIVQVVKNGSIVTQVILTDGSAYTAKVFIDSSYEGDLMAMSGVPFAIGREASSTEEPDAGVQVPDILSPEIDPYSSAGTPSSGLLGEISDGPVLAPGSADSHVMAYNYRLCATDVATHSANALPFSQFMPQHYTSSTYAAVQRIVNNSIATQSGEQIARRFLDPPTVAGSDPEVFEPYADGKFDLNGGSAFSTDVVGIPDQYPDGNWALREQIATSIQEYDQGLFYYLATDPSVPASIQNFVNQFGICKDEFADNGYFPTQLYIREGRRMIGAYVMNEANVLNKEIPAISDIIGLGGYNMDSHIHQILNINGSVFTEGGNLASVGYDCNTTATTCKITPGTPFPIPYRALTPSTTDVTNLLVSVTVSASSTAYRAIRLEPQYMIMGQAAGAAAALAIENQTTVQDVSYSQLRSVLLTPSVAGQPSQVLLRPCTLKGEVYASGTSVVAYKSIHGSNACTSEVFSCANGEWSDSAGVLPNPYYNSCAAAVAASP